MDTFDALVAIEDALIEGLGDHADVDGHDVGAGQMNIFIWTDDPTATFACSHAATGGHALWADVRAAFREESGATTQWSGRRV